MSLLEKLARFSMSYSGISCLGDFDPHTGALNNRSTTLLADTQTKMCSTAAGKNPELTFSGRFMMNVGYCG